MTNIRRAVENAFAGRLEAITGDLNADIKVARVPQEMVLPMVLVNCEVAKAYEANLGMYDCTLAVSIMTSISEADADEAHQDRVGAILEIFNDGMQLAQDISNTDFDCKGTHVIEITGEPSDTMLVDTIRVRALCQLI